MKPWMHRISTFVTIALFSTMAAAQQRAQTTPVVPRFVSYSGHAFDAQKKPIAGGVGATFAIYRDEEGGAPLWLETQTVQADGKGNYTVELGATKTEGLPLDLFSSRESRWLGVTISGQEEQHRVLLLSVPYALKAADSETLGGLPASAFMLAAPASGGSNAAMTAAPASTPPALGVSGTGTPGYLSQWTATNTIGDSALFQSGTGSTARIGINTSSPLATLNVKGTTMMQGATTMASAGVASASAGTKSYPLDLRASAYNSSTHSAANQNFQWIAEPSGNNSSSPSASLNLLFGQGSTNPAETGLKIASNGQITFAPGQTFPGGGGTVTSVGLSAPSSDFTVSGSPVTSSGTLALTWTTPPTSSPVANAIVKRNPSGGFIAGDAQFGKVYAANGVDVQPAVTAYGAGSPGSVGVFGSGDWGFYTNNNVHQGLLGNGWVKAMVVYDDVIQKKMLRCFNSTLTGAAATTPPCGFTTAYFGPGSYSVDFGFDVSSRFVQVNAYYIDGNDPPIANALQESGSFAHKVGVVLYGIRSGGGVDGIFSVFVY